jgi:tetratricopeptide (TPR) repeat protein/tRNA A-37 threonylcarbamoyl transferase component Bud32
MSEETNGLPKAVSTIEDFSIAMLPLESSDPAQGPHATEDGQLRSTKTIEQRYELEATLARMQLEDERIGVPIGVDDRYVLRELIGRGATGTVYLAEDVELDRDVAIKVVSRRIEQAQVVLELRREARALAAIDHRNVLKIFDIGSEHGEHFIVMEYANGQTLRAWQRDRPLREVIEAYLHAGRGLGAVHSCRLVHRDFKPDNVLVDQHEGRTRVRVGDFGLAVHAVAPASKGLLGTLPYMAPEQLRGEPAEQRSDQHQFCVSLWEALTGERPFGDPSRSIEGDTAIPPRPPALPRWLYPVIRRGLAFDKQDRYASMRALLGAIRRGHLWQRAQLGLAAAALAVGLGATVWATQPGPCDAAASPMAEIWTADARSDIQAAFEPPDQAGGGTMSSYIVEHLDHAAAQWSDRAVAVCEARERAPANERAGLERRAECIDRWAQRIKSRIEWLRHPEQARLEHAFELVAPLAHAGLSCALPPVIIDEAVETAIEQAEQAELLRDLDGAKALANAAVELALAKAQDAACPTQGPGGEPRSPELAAAYHRLGHVLGERRESDAALEALGRAHRHAHACNDDQRDAEAKIHAAKVLVADLEDMDAAAAALDDAWVALERVEEPEVSLRRHDERMAAGMLAERQGEHEAARSRAEESREALGDGAVDPVLAAKLDLNIGVVWHGQGQFEEAAAAYERAAQRVRQALGEHPQTRFYEAQRDLNRGLAAQERGAQVEMRRHFEQAVASGEAPVVAKALSAWAQGELESGEEEAALVRTAEILAFLSRAPDLPPFTLATAETTAGQILAALGKPGSIEVLEPACARWRKLGKADEIAQCEVTLGRALRDAGRAEQARRVGEGLRGLEVSPDGPLPAIIEVFVRSLDPEPADPEP